MWLNINPRSRTPIYQQLVDGIKEAVARGILEPGERMPTVRELASDLSINPNTIAKAYQRLEQEGIIETMRSRGSFVAAVPAVSDEGERQRQLTPLVEKLLIEAYHLGLEKEHIKKLVEESLDTWEKGGRG